MEPACKQEDGCEPRRPGGRLASYGGNRRGQDVTRPPHEAVVIFANMVRSRIIREAIYFN